MHSRMMMAKIRRMSISHVTELVIYRPVVVDVNIRQGRPARTRAMVRLWSKNPVNTERCPSDLLYINASSPGKLNAALSVRFTRFA